jgi:hypothetical protein
MNPHQQWRILYIGRQINIKREFLITNRGENDIVEIWFTWLGHCLIPKEKNHARQE